MRILVFVLVSLLCVFDSHAALVAPRILGATITPRASEQVETVAFGTISVDSAGFGSAELTISGVPSPVVTATAIGATDPINTGIVRGVGQIEYQMMVAGPAGVVPVFVSVAGTVHATTSRGSTYGLESSWSLTGDGVNVGDAIRTGQQPGSIDDGFGRTFEVLLTANSMYAVTMRAEAGIGVTDTSTGEGFATIDPTFAFASGVDTTLYSFAFSPGIGNIRPSSSVPAPTFASLLVAGIAAVALLRRRRRIGA